MQKTLAIVGAGPKAAALVARAAVLRGRLPAGQVPRLIVIERDDIGSAWTGRSSYSNGFVKLCTPGEKDVGFPYNGGGDDNHPQGSIASELYSRFSWGAYQVAEGLFADWVDRDRDHPSHSRFAHYLQWVFRQADQEIEIAEVKKIRHLSGKWRIDYEAEGVARQTG